MPFDVPLFSVPSSSSEDEEDEEDDFAEARLWRGFCAWLCALFACGLRLAWLLALPLVAGPASNRCVCFLFRPELLTFLMGGPEYP